MEIPLGCSIGASICPDEGTDYTTLFTKADQALYEVKQNGKHGFSIFRQKNQDSTEKESCGWSDLRMILGERSRKKGAYVLPFELFTTLYRFLIRFEINYDWGMYMVVFTLSSDTKNASEYVDEFVETEASCLRGSDLITKYGDDKVLTILMKTHQEDYIIPVERVINKWNQTEISKEISLKIEAEKLFLDNDH